MSRQNSPPIRNWRELETRVAALYRSLGCYARVNTRVKGLRSSHNVDVKVVTSIGGIKNIIIVECKYWQRNVGKAHVASLKAIVEDIGASQGILVSRVGFQKGAISLSKKSNIDLFSWKQLSETAAREVEVFQYKRCIDQIEDIQRILEDHLNSKVDEAARVEAFWYPTEEFSRFNFDLSQVKEGLRKARREEFPRNYLFHLPNMREPRFFRCNTFFEYISHAKLHLVKLKAYLKARRDQILLEEHPSPKHHRVLRWRSDG